MLERSAPPQPSLEYFYRWTPWNEKKLALSLNLYVVETQWERTQNRNFNLTSTLEPGRVRQCGWQKGQSSWLGIDCRMKRRKLNNVNGRRTRSLHPPRKSLYRRIPGGSSRVKFVSVQWWLTWEVRWDEDSKVQPGFLTNKEKQCGRTHLLRHQPTLSCFSKNTKRIESSKNKNLTATLELPHIQ